MFCSIKLKLEVPVFLLLGRLLTALFSVKIFNADSGFTSLKVSSGSGVLGGFGGGSGT